MNRFLAIMIVVVMLIVVVGVAKDVLLKMAIEKGVLAYTGLNLSMGGLKVGVINPVVDARDIVLSNPKGFDDTFMMKVRAFNVAYDRSALMRGETRLTNVRLDLTRLIVERNSGGTLNLDALRRAVDSGKVQNRRPAMPGRESAPSLPPLRIDRLHLVIGTVVYRDRAGAYEFPVNLDETFTNITDPAQLVGIIIVKALGNTNIPQLAGVDMGAFQGYAEGVAAQMLAVSGAKASSLLKTISVQGIATPEKTRGETTKASEDAAKQLNQLLRSFSGEKKE